jgi:serine protease AprX
MQRRRSSPTLAWVACLSLILSLVGGIMLNRKASAAQKSEPREGQKFSQDLGERAKGPGAATDIVHVILQLSDKPSGELNALLNRNGIHLRKSFNQLGAHLVDLPASAVEELASFDEVSFVSPDRELASDGHVAMTSGAGSRRSQTTSSGTPYTLDGSGIGVAIVDSGIFNHKAFLDDAGKSRIVYSKDFTGENRTDDPYGHGTHVAGIVAANKLYYNAAYCGVAPNANLVNLRVLNSQGTGTTSGLLAALDWLLTYRTTYNIRVANLSLGMPAIDSYRDDPVCKAVRRLVDAGLVVVAAAGNDGKNSLGAKVYGHIHSPGNEPSAITVGASNSYGTDARNDDTVTTYSSRGPTRSFSTDSYGRKHYDNLLKPDVVAPGNKIISAESPNNALVQQNPALDLNLTTDPANEEMRLSGTSMATPVVSAGAAMLLQMNPKLTPNMVKMLLMYTAQPLAGFNTLEQGAGQVNIAGAVDLTKLMRTDLTSSTSLGTSLLTGAAPTPQTTIDTFTFTWAQGIISNYTYVKGSNLITKYQKIYGSGVLCGDSVIIRNGVLVADSTMITSGLTLGAGTVTSSGGTISDGVQFTTSAVLLGDGVLLNDGVILGDGVVMSDGVLVNDGVIVGDKAQALLATLYGDNTASMY